MLSQLSFELSRRLYLGIPDMTLAASISAATSYFVNRHGFYSMPNPQTAATFAACTVAGKYVLYQFNQKKNNLQKDDSAFPSWVPAACTTGFVGYMLLGYDKRTLLQAALSAAASMLFHHKLIRISEEELLKAQVDPSWLFNLTNQIIRKAFEISPEVAAQAGLAWAATQIIRAHGYNFSLNPFHVFALSTLWRVTDTLSNAMTCGVNGIASRPYNQSSKLVANFSDTKKPLVIRSICLVALASALAHKFEPSLLTSNYKPFIQTLGATGCCLATSHFFNKWLTNQKLSLSQLGLRMAGNFYKNMPLVAIETALTSFGAAYISKACGFSFQVATIHAFAISLLYHATEHLYINISASSKQEKIFNALKHTLCVLSLAKISTPFVPSSLQTLEPFAKTFAVATASCWVARKSLDLLEYMNANIFSSSELDKEILLLKTPLLKKNISIDELGYETLQVVYTNLPNITITTAFTALISYVAQCYKFNVSIKETASFAAGLSTLNYALAPLLTTFKNSYLNKANTPLRRYALLGLLSQNLASNSPAQSMLRMLAPLFILASDKITAYVTEQSRSAF